MKLTTRHSLALGAVLAAAVSFSTPVAADGDRGQNAEQSGASGMMGGQGGMMGGQDGAMGGQGGHDMQQMMARMHSQMMGGQGGGMMGQQGGGIGYMRGLGMANQGAMNAEDLQAALTAKFAEFDADGDGSLSIAEFEALHSAAIREQMVDRFQMLDNDGDGMVTSDEISAVVSAGMGQNMKPGMRAQGATNGMGAGHENGAMMQNQSN